MIIQGTKNCSFLDPPDLPVVVARLRAAGYREAPHWYLTKRGAGLLITPKTRRTGFGFRLWAAPAVLDAYGDLFEWLPIEAFVAQLLHDGWQEHYNLCLVGQKVVISIVEGIGRTGTTTTWKSGGFVRNLFARCSNRLALRNCHEQFQGRNNHDAGAACGAAPSASTLRAAYPYLLLLPADLPLDRLAWVC